MLWFASPPSNTPKIPTPKYSLKYLSWLARKRKRERGEEDEALNGKENEEAVENDMDVDPPADDGDDSQPAKRSRTTILPLNEPERPKIKVQPTVTEILASFRDELVALRKANGEPVP